MRREKKYLAEALRGKKYPAHQVARKKNLADHKSPTHPPSRVKWSAPKAVSVFLCVSLKLIRSCKENHILKTRT